MGHLLRRAKQGRDAATEGVSMTRRQIAAHRIVDRISRGMTVKAALDAVVGRDTLETIEEAVKQPP